jgi:hypothetical protein
MSSREFYKRKINRSSCERYSSLSLMTNKVKIESKDGRSKKKMEIREYLQKARLAGGKNVLGVMRKKKKEEDF